VHSVFTNTIIASAGRLINAVLGVFVIAIITRQLGPGSYGAFILLLSFGTIIQLFSDAGLYLTLTKEVAQTDSPTRLFSSVLSLRLVLLVAAFLTGALLFPFIPSLKGWLSVYLILALGLACQSLSQLLVGVFQYQGEIWRATFGDLVGRVVQIILLLFLWPYQPSVAVVAVIFAISTASSLFLHQILLSSPFNFRPRINFGLWRLLLRSSWPLGLMLLLNAIYFRVDTLILSLFRGESEVGWYGVAYRIIESGLFFSAMFGGLLLPKISAAIKSSDVRKASQYLEEGLKLLLTLIVPIVIILLFFSQTIVNLIAGSDFAASAPLLSWLSLALAIMYFGNLFGFALVALGRQRALLKLSLFLVFFNGAANFLLIPLWGSLAAAWTTIFTEAIAAGTAGLIVYRTLPFSISWEFLSKAALVGVLGIVVIQLTSAIPAIIQLIITIIIFGLLIITTHLISPKQLRLLRST
jgi:O-antigen/teichoic acid export membrane protein